MLSRVEAALAAWEARITMPREFVVPGETRLSAAIEVAAGPCAAPSDVSSRSARSGHPLGPWLVPWLNRVADLLWVLARAAEQAEGAPSCPRPRQRTLLGPGPGRGRHARWHSRLTSPE